MSRAGSLFWHHCVQQALTPDFQLWDQMSESGRKGPGGPVCNCGSGVSVDDGRFYWGQVRGRMAHSHQATNSVAIVLNMFFPTHGLDV